MSEKGIPHTPLLGYTPTKRAHRDPDYYSEYDGGDWNPEDGTGYWTWSDVIFQGGAWIDLHDRHGVLFFATLGNGRVWYENSDRNAERGSHALFIYAPLDLGKVASGVKEQWQIQPVYRRNWEFPGMRYPLEGFRGNPQKMIFGVSYDSIDKKLYVGVRFPEPDRIWRENTAAVFVYRIRESSHVHHPIRLKAYTDDSRQSDITQCWDLLGRSIRRRKGHAAVMRDSRSIRIVKTGRSGKLHMVLQ
jgi:hypothetical protein